MLTFFVVSLLVFLVCELSDLDSIDRTNSHWDELQ